MPLPASSRLCVLARSALGLAAAMLVFAASLASAAPPARIDCSAQLALDAPAAPLLVVTDTSYLANPFGCYLTEILRAEGLVAFQHARLSLVVAEIDPLAYLSSFEVVLLAEMDLDASEEQLFRDYVNNGGKLVGMRPDTGLADVFGLTHVAARTEQLLQFFAVDTASAPGMGIVSDSLQFHGEADDYTLDGATQLAALYDDLSTPSANPAATLNAYGAGQAAAFTFDLARSIVLTRQGNPAWTDLEGGDLGGYRPGHDLFYNAGQHYNEPARLSLPQADEAQRFLANLVLELSGPPLPRMWYLPNTHKRIVVNTGDGESLAGSDLEPAMDAAESYGGFYTHYFREAGITGTSVVMEADWLSRGHETGVHSHGTDSDPNYGANSYDPIVASLVAKFGHGARTARNHTIDWVGWSEMAEIYEAAGTGLDLNYYHIPYYLGSAGTANGFFTGSGLPQRFSNENGVLLGVYQQLTPWPDEWFANSGLTASATEAIVTGMLEDAETDGYYGAFVNNIHQSRYNSADITSVWANALWAYCQANGIPMWSAEMLLDFVEARNESNLDNVVWDGGLATLSFDFSTPTARADLTVMIPTVSPVGPLLSVDVDASPVAYPTETIKGRGYALVNVPGASHAVVASYGIDTTPPAISNEQVTAITDTEATVTWDTDENATSVVDYGTTSGNLTQQATGVGFVTGHSVPLSGLLPDTPYFYQVSSEDPATNSASSGELSFQTGLPRWTETTDADFADGTLTDVEIVGSGDACIQLDSATGFLDGFDGVALNPADWTERSWDTFGAPPPGAITVAGSFVSVTDRSYIRTTQTWFEETVEGQVTLEDGANAHFGWATTVQGGDDGITDPEWAMFSVSSGAYLARTLANDGGASQQTDVSAFATPGASHLLRVVWSAGGQIEFYVDDVLVATHNRTFPNPMRVYLSSADPPQDAIADWVSISGAFSTPGSYESSIFDSGSTADWSELLWSGNEPVDTSVAFETRTSADGVIFSAWEAIAGSLVLSPDARYAQYRATLTTADLVVSPEICDVSLVYASGPDLSPPAIAGTVPVDAAVDVGVDGDITIQFSEAIATGTFSAQISGGVSFTTSFQNGDTQVVLDPDTALGFATAYTVTVEAGLEDLSGNATVSPLQFSFTTGVQVLPVCLVDDQRADFALGTPAATQFAEVDDGEVVLSATEASDFDGSTLPAGWSLHQDWTGSGTATVASGTLTVEQSNVGTDASYGPGRALEFVATFASGGENNQHAGFATTFSGTPWAMFSTGSGSSGSCATCLQVRTWLGGAEPFINETIDATGALVGTPHRYRIEWTATELTYFVDDVQVAQHVVALLDSLAVRASDINVGPSLSLDWLRMSPFSTPGSFESRVFDAGGSADWGALSYAADLPTGTSVDLEVRTGDIAVPDGSWTAFTPIASGGAVGASSRFLQYRADLATTDVDRSPALEDVTVTCLDTAAPVIVDSDPLPGAMNVLLDADLLVRFNEAVVPGTFAAQIVGGPTFSTSFIDGDTAVVLDPDLSLLPFSAYTVQIDPGLEDLQGNATASPLLLSFTTTNACFSETTLAHFADGTFVDTETVANGDGAVQLSTGESPVQLLSDDFAEPDGPASNWTPLDGSWAIVGGEYDFTIPSNYAASIITGQAPPDFVLQARQKIVSFAGVGVGGFVWNIQDPTGGGNWKNGSYMLQWDTRAGTLQNARIFRWDNPTTLTLVAGVDLPDVVLDTWYELRIEVRGSDFDLYVDGAPVVSGSDATYGAGALGLLGWVDGDTRYDDVLLTELADGFLASGSYSSNVADSGTSTTWTNVDWNVDLPTDTDAQVLVRAGDQPVPDGSWTLFTPVASSGSAANVVGRYAQYRVDLTSSDPVSTSQLLDIQLACQPTCGDGVPHVGEECDDGNTAAGDGCSASCSFEGPDADGDGILNEHETGTGVFNGPTDTGTDPLNPDTDGDGWNDWIEIVVGSDPNDPESVPPVSSVPALGTVGRLLLVATLLGGAWWIVAARRRRGSV